MIFEYADLDHNVLLVDGFLPSKKTLVDVLSSEKRKLFYEENPNDETLLEDFEHQMTIANGSRVNRKERTGAYVHLLKPIYPGSKLEYYNPVLCEFGSLKEKKNNYRLFVTIPTKEGNSENFKKAFPELREAFFDTLNTFKFSIKPEDSYQNLDNFKNYLRDLSDSLLHRYFLPFDSIMDHLKTIGFDSEDAIIG